MRESEEHVEFKKSEHGNVSYNGADKQQPKDRRKCILGYVTALCAMRRRKNMMIQKGRIERATTRNFYGR